MFLFIDVFRLIFFSCSKELGQWDLLMEFGKTKGHTNPFLGTIVKNFLLLLLIFLFIITCVTFSDRFSDILVILVLESAWRVPEWQSMKEALAQVIFEQL